MTKAKREVVRVALHSRISVFHLADAGKQMANASCKAMNIIDIFTASESKVN